MLPFQCSLHLILYLFFYFLFPWFLAFFKNVFYFLYSSIFFFYFQTYMTYIKLLLFRSDLCNIMQFYFPPVFKILMSISAHYWLWSLFYFISTRISVFIIFTFCLWWLYKEFKFVFKFSDAIISFFFFFSYLLHKSILGYLQLMVQSSNASAVWP